MAVAAVTFLSGTAALAAEFKRGENAVLPASETVASNFYTAGGMVNIMGNVAGDAYAAGGTLFSNGKVGQDLVIAGGNVYVNNEVGDDLRAAGGNITINSRIRGEAMVAGGNIMIMPDTNITKNAYIYGGQILLNGVITGNAEIYGEKIELYGTINGNAKIKAKQLVIGPDTVIKGVLTYSAPTETVVPGTAKIGKVEYTKLAETKKSAAVHPPAILAGLAGFVALMAVVKIISLALIALVIFLIFKKGTNAVVLGALTNFWQKVLTGFVTLVIAPLAMFLVGITFIGLPFSIMACLLYVLLLMLSCIGAGAVFGTWLFSLFKKKERAVNWMTVLIGSLIFSIVCVIPFVGWLVGFVFCLSLFGELLQRLYAGLKKAV